MIEHAEASEDRVEVMLHKVRVARRDQRQNLGSGGGHIRRVIEPVLEKEKRTENEARSMPLHEEIRGQQKWDQPLQQCASPKTERGSEPGEQIVSAFMHDQVGDVDEQESAVSGERVRQERDIKDQPRHQCWAGDWLPRFENRLQWFEHARLK